MQSPGVWSAIAAGRSPGKSHPVRLDRYLAGSGIATEGVRRRSVAGGGSTRAGCPESKPQISPELRAAE